MRSATKVPFVIIVVAYAHMTLEEANVYKPTIVFPDETTNKLRS